MKTKILIISLILLIAIQLVPYGKDHVNPQVIAEPQWDSPETRALFMRACGDCHSYETKWPWYSNVAPASWLVTSDVNEAQQHFNVSAWKYQEKNKGDEAAYELREGKMPPLRYLAAHTEARLGEQEKAALLKGLSSTFGH
ncbi:MAG: heme-binding domain-containing protein [Proteobacteria bacterium]|nr:cytochrome C [Desulfocapsa sp.]MBU3946206.1 heme-binding domain-containing protein [Pseudomonadota bacterium]MCG2745218.1 heme-binding domain-containing protein [Desulfobacteraceae bacterium]MBU3982989.1 heme-binding domain-containing protein [Pseudomonadota bacterium]MBU4027829.1 heme-binding domain-containing protein [Pseudomonadota bacterium]